MYIEKDKFLMPELTEGDWLNSEPMDFLNLKGKVVLVDFWDYTCVNCIRTLPYLKEWHNRYFDSGLQIVGVHAPEFSLSRKEDNIRMAMERFDINYPVVMDNDYKLWHAFENKYWPAKYIADKTGFLRYAQFGEGGYLETELAIQLLLREVDPDMQLPDLLKPVRDTDIPGIHCYKVSPELYLGYARGKPGNPEGLTEGGITDYKTAFEFKPDTVYFGGKWLISKEFAKPALDNGDDNARLHLLYTSSEINLVIDPAGQRSFKLYVMQNDSYLPNHDWGEDIKIDDNGNTYVEVNEPRMYNLVKNREFGTKRLKLSTNSNDCCIYAFTFVSCTV